MKKIDRKSLLEEPSGERVSREKQVGWKGITLILIGIYVSLPGFFSGIKIGYDAGLYKSVSAFFIGGLILAIISSCCAFVGAKTNLTTYKIIQYVFGKKGALLINSIFGISLFCWFGINLALFGEAMLSFFNASFWWLNSHRLFVIVGGVLMVATTIFGFKALSRLAGLAVPLLIVALVAVTLVSIGFSGFDAIFTPKLDSSSLGGLISVVVGSSIVGAILTPDICRYARSYKHAVLAVSITFVVALPLIFIAAAVSALATNRSDLMSIIAVLELGPVAIAVVVFTAWTTNSANLYGSSLNLSVIFEKMKYWQLVLIAGGFGVLFAVSGILDAFVPFLLIIGIGMPPVAGVYVVHFLLYGNGAYKEEVMKSNAPICNFAMIAWFSACVVGFLSFNEYFVLSHIPAVDSLLVSASIYLLLEQCVGRKDTLIFRDGV